MDALLAERARAWLAEDPDPETRAELQTLLAAGDEAAVADRFAGRLEFGTAGLRGALGAGPNRMNRVVVQQTAAGLAAYLSARGGGTVVVGFDARRNSDVFAEDSAAVLEGAGLHTWVLPRPLPTPVLAFAILHLGCAAGVMVTASHNPPQDNGYKVYLDDGRQIVPPADAEIAAAVDAAGPLAELPRSAGWQRLDDRIVDAYLDAVAGLSLVQARDVRVAYTPLHGVGRTVVEAAFARAGFPPPAVVAEQADPDPTFPTVPFPNPEEPGAMDLALAAGAASAADVVIANDPDADRCAAAVGGRMLTGDELGALLADHILRHTSGKDRLVASSLVSSTLLAKIAAAHGVRHRATLTGFKWITRAGDAVPGSRFVFGYEEALGYCVAGTGWPVRDKDGISAALLVAELAADAKTRGQTLCDRLDALARAHGLHATAPWTVRVADLRQIAAEMRRLRDRPPAGLGGLAVLETVDLSAGSDDLPPTDGLLLRLDGDARVVVRPSGTEPKLKAYLEAVVPVVDGDVDGARAVAATRLDAVRADLAAATGLGG